jgi:bifunctional oligoribonuclease and PAP phosphatase NrnA
MEKHVSFNEIWNVFKNSNKISMSLHLAPDGDSLASCVALKYAIEKHLGKKVTLVSPDALDRTLGKLDYAREVEFGKNLNQLESFDTIVFLDSSTPEVVLGKDSTTPPSHNIVNIDHHHTNKQFGTLNYVISTKASACSVLLQGFREIGLEFDKELSTRLMLGICTDTNFFSYSQESVSEASFLIDHGADYMEIVKKIRLNIPLVIKQYHSVMIRNLKRHNNYAYSTISLADIEAIGLNEAELRWGIAAIQDIEDFEFVFNLREAKDKINGSFRSRTNIDTSVFAKELGGGGHKAASAFSLEKMPLEQAVQKVIGAIDKLGIHRY